MRPGDRVAQVELALDHVLPERGVRVLEVGQPDLGAGVQRVDRHLAVGGSGDLHAPVDQAGRGLGDPPDSSSRTSLVSARKSSVPPAASSAYRCSRGRQQLATAAVERAVQVGEEGERLRREDLVVAVVHRPVDADAVNAHVTCSSRGNGGGPGAAAVQPPVDP